MMEPGFDMPSGATGLPADPSSAASPFLYGPPTPSAEGLLGPTSPGHGLPGFPSGTGSSLAAPGVSDSGAGPDPTALAALHSDTSSPFGHFVASFGDLGSSFEGWSHPIAYGAAAALAATVGAAAVRGGSAGVTVLGCSGLPPRQAFRILWDTSRALPAGLLGSDSSRLEAPLAATPVPAAASGSRPAAGLLRSGTAGDPALESLRPSGRPSDAAASAAAGTGLPRPETGGSPIGATLIVPVALASTFFSIAALPARTLRFTVLRTESAATMTAFRVCFLSVGLMVLISALLSLVE
jgi:hypothetical protein